MNPGLIFSSFSSLGRTLRGYEAMHMLRQGQLVGIAKGNILAQIHVIAQMFGIGT